MNLPLKSEYTKNKTLFDSLTKKVPATKSLLFATSFSNDFMQMYSETLYIYFRKQGILVQKAEFRTQKNRSLVYNWAKKMLNTKEFPFPIDSEKDIGKYRQIEFWKSVLMTLLKVGSSEAIGMYTQTTNGIFKYVESGKFYAHLRLSALSDSDSKLSKTILKDLTSVDYLKILAVFTVILYERANNTVVRRSSEFYRYSGFIDYKQFPIFKKYLVENSPNFRSVLVEFSEFYYSLIKYFKLDDYMQYEDLLDFIAELLVNPNAKKVLNGYDSKQIEHFITNMASLVMENE